MSWRDMGRTVQIKGIGDARVIAPILIFVFFYNWYTFFFSIACIALLMVMRYKGYQFLTLVRWARGRAAGNVRTGRMPIMKKNLYEKQKR